MLAIVIKQSLNIRPIYTDKKLNVFISVYSWFKKKILQVPFADRNENGPAFSNNYDSFCYYS